MINDEKSEDIEFDNYSSDIQSGTDSYQNMMNRKIDRWKKDLLDTGKKNRMINYRESKRQTLNILEPSASELFNLLALKERTLSFQRPLNKDSDLRIYSVLSLLETLSYKLPVHVGDIAAEGTVMEREKTLKNLRAKAKLAQEEQGTNILYLSFGFILWRENNKDNTPWVKSPLLMMPVQLGVKSLNAPYTISKSDDEIEVNPTLDYLFNQDYGIDLPTFELKNKDSIDEYFEQIEDIVDKKGWKLIREVSLGMMSFLKISMYHDLNNNREMLIKNPVIQAICGNRDALDDLPEEVYNFNYDKTKPTEWHEVVDSDSSQQEAIYLSKKGVSFVMQGPPGTGKSQTITNIIAEALGDGKKVLFVSEKSAALQVVLKRLKEVRLDDFCLSLHDYKANKKEIIDNIGENLSLSPEYVDNSMYGELTELLHDREYLDEYADDLHKKIDPLGESVYSAFGKLAELSDATSLDFTFENPDQLSKEEYHSVLYVVDAFEKALRNIGGKLSDNSWFGTSAKSSGQLFKNEMMTKTEGLDRLCNEISNSIFAFNNTYGTSLHSTWGGYKKDTDSINSLIKLPLFDDSWMDAGQRSLLLERAHIENQIDCSEQTHAKRLYELINEVRENWTIGDLPFSFEELEKIYGEAKFEDASDNSLLVKDYRQEKTNALGEIVQKLSDISENFERATQLLDIEQPDQFKSIQMIYGILELLLDAPSMCTNWFDIRKYVELCELIDNAKIHQQSVKQKEAVLLNSWEPGVLELDSESMLGRFKTKYTGKLHRIQSDYRKDIKQLKLLSKMIGIQIGEVEAIALLHQLEDLNNEKKWFSENEMLFKTMFSDQYKGVDTDWDRIRVGLDRAREISNQFPYANIPAEVIKAIQKVVDSIQLIAECRKAATILRGESVNNCKVLINSIGISFDDLDELSISRVVLPATREVYENELAKNEPIEKIDHAHINTPSTIYEISLLVNDFKDIVSENNWFKDNIPDIPSVLNDCGYENENNIEGALKCADVILKTHDELAVKNESSELISLFGNRYTGNFTDWNGIINDIEEIDAFEKTYPSEDWKEFARSICDDENKRNEISEKIHAINEKIREVESKYKFFKGLFPDEDMDQIPLTDVSSRYVDCVNGFMDLNKWLDVVETKADCDKNGLSSFTELVLAANNDIYDVKRAFERGFYLQWVALAVDEIPSIREFRRRVHEQRLKKFTKLDEKQFDISINRIRQSIISSFPDRNAVAGARSELKVLEHEMEKKRRIMPLRKLFHEIPNLLLTLKPCLMMSPLSVAYFLNAEDYHFDMVIFDEASQIFPQDAIGAIFRADQSIIAGDTRQLPPTSFFTTSTSNGNDDYDNDDDDYEDEVYASILEETANVLPNRTLRWHYRSKHEHLIAFSNREIYRNELVTFPSVNESRPDTGVEFVYVEDGYYEGGGKNCNVLEARKCVELVKAHIDNHSDRSLGIIAFSEKQQTAISYEIQRFRENNPQYEYFFAEGKEDEFFVKNLENVQGDERDTIIFSVGYAKTKEQKATNKPMSMRFGPLGVSGGERRLNVAITRAKNNVKLVSSILPSDIDLSKTESEGIRMLRSYIEFAMNGAISLSVRDKKTEPDDFVNAIFSFISQKGYKVRQSIGCSDYKIDIAVEHPNIENEFVAGIECDGVSYVSAKTARDRDRLRKTILSNMGWSMYRVWSTEWYNNPEIEEKKLIEFIDSSFKKSGIQKKDSIRTEVEKNNLEKSNSADANNITEKNTSDDMLSNDQADYIPEWAAIGSKVVHDSFGEGTVSDINDDFISVIFDVGEKHLALPGAFSKGYLVKDDSDEIPYGESYIDSLSDSGFTIIDNSDSSLIIWVLYDSKSEERFVQIARRFNLEYKLERRGAMATNGRAAWRIMV